MAIQVVFNHAADKPAAPSFFMTRQPVLDRGQELVAFELSFRHDHASSGMPTTATSSVLGHFIELNMLKVLGEFRGLVNLDAESLFSDIFDHIPRTKLILVLGEQIVASDAAAERVAELAQKGFVFALDVGMSNTAGMEKFLPLVGVVRFDLHTLPQADLLQLTPQAQFANKKLLAAHVETLAQFDACLALGFDYFQGYYFAKPVLAVGTHIEPSHLAIVDLINMISNDADSAEVEERIKQDVSLGLNLLRLVNTAAVGLHRIDSLRQALMVLGRNQLLSWMQVMLYTHGSNTAPSVKPLLMLATTRGKLLELVAQRHRLGNRGIADAAFTVGIMSLMDTLFSLPMEEIIQQIAVVDEVKQALLTRLGYYGELLLLAEATERPSGADVLPQLLARFQLTSSDLCRLQAEAFEWSNNIACSLHY